MKMSWTTISCLLSSIPWISLIIGYLTKDKTALIATGMSISTSFIGVTIEMISVLGGAICLDGAWSDMASNMLVINIVCAAFSSVLMICNLMMLKNKDKKE